VTNFGNSGALLCCDVSFDGLTVAAGTDLKGVDALIQYWCEKNILKSRNFFFSSESLDSGTLGNQPFRCVCTVRHTLMISPHSLSIQRLDETSFSQPQVTGCYAHPTRMRTMKKKLSFTSVIWAPAFHKLAGSMEQAMAIPTRLESGQQRTWRRSAHGHAKYI